MIDTKILAKLTSAIRDKRVTLIRYEGLDYVMECYVLYQSAKGTWLVHGYKQGGDYKETRGPHWANLKIDQIEEVNLLARRWDEPKCGYNPTSKVFCNVLCATGAEPPEQDGNEIATDSLPTEV